MAYAGKPGDSVRNIPFSIRHKHFEFFQKCRNVSAVPMQIDDWGKLFALSKNDACSVTHVHVSFCAMKRPRLSRPDVVGKAGDQAGAGTAQQMRQRSLASAASRSAVVSGCAWRHKRACYTTSSQDAGRGAADKSREKGETRTHGNTGGGEVPLAACSGADEVGAPRCPVQSWDRGQPGSSPGACRLRLLTHLLTEPQRELCPTQPTTQRCAGCAWASLPVIMTILTCQLWKGVLWRRTIQPNFTIWNSSTRLPQGKGARGCFSKPGPTKRQTPS